MTTLRRHRSADSLLLFLVAGLIGLPVLTVAAHVFLPSQGSWAHLATTVLPGYAMNSFWLLLGVGTGTLLVGAGTAWLVTMHDFPGRRLFEWALILPLAVPAYVLAYAYTDFLDVAGPVQSLLRAMTDWRASDYAFPPIRSLGGAIATFILALYPYVYLAARAAFLQQGAAAVEAGRTLGCTPQQAFLRVALPIARPALAAGVALALMETLADFGAVSYFGVQTFTTGIYRSWFSMGDRVAAAQLASVLLAVIALLLFAERTSRRRARFFETSRRSRPLGTYRLSGGRARLATFACALPLLLGFLLPTGILLNLAVDGGVAAIGARYPEMVRNSLTLAALTAGLAVAIALALSYGVRVGRSAVGRLAVRLASLGYAIPGSIIAVGVLIPLTSLDNALDSVMREGFGVSTGLLLTGSITALVFAYLVRFLALAQQTVGAGLERITPSMDAAAATLGAGPRKALLAVHLPMLQGSLLTALLLVFVEVMKELPATMIMRPFDYATLAVEAHNLASDERLAEAAAPALTIVAVGLLPVYLLSRLIGSSRPGVRRSLLPPQLRAMAEAVRGGRSQSTAAAGAERT